jgi:hypothetical protein
MGSTLYTTLYQSNSHTSTQWRFGTYSGMVKMGTGV